MIEITQLSKHYGELKAVDSLSFSLAPGEILGFLGPNGAGKSTTMKMLTGFLRPSAGRVMVWGADMWKDPIEAQKRIGYLPEGAPAYEEMSVYAFLSFIAEARGLSSENLEQSILRVVRIMSLESVVHQRIETLSKGFKRRVGLAQAIIHDPDLLILDEPTDGLDPNQKRQVREMIRGLSKEKIVIVSTHLLEEVTAVCNRVMVLSSGRIVSDTTPSELLAQSQYHGAVTLSIGAESVLSAVKETLAAVKGVKSVEQEGDDLVIFPEDGEQGLFSTIRQLAQDEGWHLEGLYVEKGRLDEVFSNLTEGATQ